MTKNIKPVPEGYRTITAGLCVKDAPKAIEFYKKAFGAQELLSMPGPGGKIMHAELKIGDSIFFLSDECPEMGPNSGRSPQTLKGFTSALFLYVPDVDAAYQKAVNAGAKPAMPVTDMFWGDRYGQVMDPFGHSWSLATHTEDLTPEQIAERQKEFFAAAAK